jgi:hypothetical protein
MQSHKDRPDHADDALLKQLMDRAKELTEAKENVITAGDDEQPLRGWKHRGMSIQQMPDDPQGVLRISVGGNVGFGYCTFRGPREACRTLLQQALAGLTKNT